MNPTLRFACGWCLAALALLVWARCDSVVPEEDPLLVVEAFIDVGQPLPILRLWQTRPLDEPYAYGPSTAVADAEVVLNVGGDRFSYQPLDGAAGRYGPVQGQGHIVSPGAMLKLDARWGAHHAQAESHVPPPIRIDSARIKVPDAPVDGIILDSLFIDPVKLDSLQLDSLKTGAERGLVYLVEVTVWWTVDFPEVGADSSYWIRAQLKPRLSSRPVFDDFFLQPEQIRREQELARGNAGQHNWTGVYAVPVSSPEEPLPPHPLRVAILRSGRDYARYAASRRDPEHREPVTNVRGGIGIFAGLSIDSLWIQVSKDD